MDELLKKRAKLVEDMRVMVDKCGSESRDFTEDEEKQYLAYDKELDGINNMIERSRKLAEQEEALKAPQKVVYIAGRKASENDDEREFRNLGEFIFALRFNPNDPRLAKCEYREFETRDQSMGVGAEGGFAVPEKFKPTMLQVSPQEAIIRPRATVIPATDPPDAKLSMPSLDQGAAQNMYGGITVYKVAEAGTLTETQAKLKQVTLEPQGLGAYTYLSNKLIRNWGAASGTIETLLRKAMIGYEETQFYNGTGVGGPQGVLTAACAIGCSRATASTIIFAEISAMFARLKFGGSPIWIASQTTLPQLVTIRDTNNNNLWVQSVAPGVPPTLYGIPVFFHDRSVGLGTKGDLILCDWSYYLIQDGSGPYVSVSEHVAFLTDRTAIKIIWNVDGKPWLTEAIPLEGSTSNTVSPFVILNA